MSHAGALRFSQASNFRFHIGAVFSGHRYGLFGVSHVLLIGQGGASYITEVKPSSRACFK